MTAIITDIGLIIDDPYIIFALAPLCLYFKDTLADMFSSVFSFTKSFLCVAFRLTMLFFGVMVCIFALAFGQTFLNFTDRLIATLFIAFLIVLVQMLLSFTKRVLLMFIGWSAKARAVKSSQTFTFYRPQAFAAAPYERGFRLRQ